MMSAVLLASPGFSLFPYMQNKAAAHTIWSLQHFWSSAAGDELHTHHRTLSLNSTGAGCMLLTLHISMHD